MYGFKILCEISKGTFEISHKILNPYAAKYAFWCLLFLRMSYDIFELWRHNPEWDGPQDVADIASDMGKIISLRVYIGQLGDLDKWVIICWFL